MQKVQKVNFLSSISRGHSSPSLEAANSVHPPSIKNIKHILHTVILPFSIDFVILYILVYEECISDRKPKPTVG